MPGKGVRSWSMYHALRKRGKSKANAAKITNARASRGRKGKKR